VSSARVRSLRRRLDRVGAVRYTTAMDQGSRKTGGSKDVARADRLKAALKANLGRRKSQARARTTSAETSGAEIPNKSEAARSAEAGTETPEQTALESKGAGDAAPLQEQD